MPSPEPEVASLFTGTFLSLPDAIEAHGRERPDAMALVCGEISYTWSAVAAVVGRFARALARRGIGRGGAVAILAENSAEHLIALLGALKAGAVACPLPLGVSAQAIRGMLADCAANIVFVDGSARTEALVRGLDVPVASLGREALEAWLDAAAGGRDAVLPQIAPGDPFNIIYSSGTTGIPRGVVQSHVARWNMVRGMRMPADDVLLVSTPLYSSTTLSCGLVAGLYSGVKTVILRRFNAVSYLQTAERARASVAVLVPVQVRRILALRDFASYDLSAFRLKMCTSARLDAALKRDLVLRWPGQFVEAYAVSEGGVTCVLEANKHLDKLHTVGRAAPGFELRIIDEAGRELPAGVPGEVVGCGPSAMTMYHNHPELTAGAEWFDSAGRRYMRSGDIGMLDEDGFLILLERKKDVINVGGHKVYPCDIEQVLHGHPSVDEAAVVAAPCTQWGETSVAFVVQRGARPADPGAILHWANGRLGKIQRLSAVRLIDELPRNPVGKVLKRQLREMAAA